MKKIWIPQAILSVLFLWALYPDNPYGYYIFLRWIACGILLYLTYLALEEGKRTWIWIFSINALIYNPIIRFHFTREFWTVLNMISVVILVVSVFFLKKTNHDIAVVSVKHHKKDVTTKDAVVDFMAEEEVIDFPDEAVDALLDLVIEEEKDLEDITDEDVMAKMKEKETSSAKRIISEEAYQAAHARIKEKLK